MEETTTTEAVGPAGTLDDPIPAGVWTTVGDIAVAVISVNKDAADVVMDENQFNQPPGPGQRFVMWEIALANTSNTEAAAFGEVSFTVVGESAVAYESFDATCGVLPDGLDQFRTVFPGGSLTGNMCWQVAETDVESLKLIVDEFTFSGDRIVIAQPPAGETFEVVYPTPVVPDSTGDAGTRGNPLSIGDAIEVGDWEITLTGSDPDATESILGENQFNDPPAEGRRFVTVSVSAVYAGRESESLFEAVSFNAVGDLAVAYMPEDSCGVISNELDTFSEVFPGGEVIGDLCWSVDDSDVESLVVYVFESFSFDQTKTFVGLS